MQQNRGSIFTEPKGEYRAKNADKRVLAPLDPLIRIRKGHPRTPKIESN